VLTLGKPRILSDTITRIFVNTFSFAPKVSVRVCCYIVQLQKGINGIMSIYIYIYSVVLMLNKIPYYKYYVHGSVHHIYIYIYICLCVCVCVCVCVCTTDVT
jgi:hypothetical protein